MLGFVAFPMPELFPRHYWLFHSLWHVLLAAGYYQLYALIEAESLAAYKEARRHKHVRPKRHAQARDTKQNLAVAEQHLPLLSKAKSDVSGYLFDGAVTCSVHACKHSSRCISRRARVNYAGLTTAIAMQARSYGPPPYPILKLML